MSHLPLTPHFKTYRGSKEALRRKASEYNRMAQRVADHVSALIANNPDETQMYLFYSIAYDLGLTEDQVRSAISDGGYDGITIGVREDDRQMLARYKKTT
jgi:hypothetical protein